MSGEARYYLCRLLPPRPRFALDMSAEEAAMMKEHAAYWRRLLDRGVAIVFGPVMDAEAPHGMGVVSHPSRSCRQCATTTRPSGRAAACATR